MAQDAVDRALKTGKLGVQARPCATTHLKLVRGPPGRQHRCVTTTRDSRSQHPLFTRPSVVLSSVI